MTRQEAESVLGRLSYKPGYTFVMAADTIYLKAPEQPNVLPGRGPVRLEFYYQIPYEGKTELQFVVAVRALVEQAERHEMNEWLRLDGMPVCHQEHR